MSSTLATPMHGAPGRTSEFLRAFIVLVMAVAQIAASVYVTQSGQDGFTEPFPGGDPPIIPAGYAFAVPGPIYLGSLVFAVYHALPSQRGRPLLRAIGWWVATGFAATASWVLVAADPRRIGVMVIILAMVAPLGVFAGWATVASPATVAALGVILVFARVRRRDPGAASHV